MISYVLLCDEHPFFLGIPHSLPVAQALEELQEHAHLDRETGAANGHEPESRAAHTPIWEAFIQANLEIPDEELDLLPIDGATQHDHYIYGTLKRPV